MLFSRSNYHKVRCYQTLLWAGNANSRCEIASFKTRNQNTVNSDVSSSPLYLEGIYKRRKAYCHQADSVLRKKEVQYTQAISLTPKTTVLLATPVSPKIVERSESSQWKPFDSSVKTVDDPHKTGSNNTNTDFCELEKKMQEILNCLAMFHILLHADFCLSESPHRQCTRHVCLCTTHACNRQTVNMAAGRLSHKHAPLIQWGADRDQGQIMFHRLNSRWLFWTGFAPNLERAETLGMENTRPWRVFGTVSLSNIFLHCAETPSDAPGTSLVWLRWEVKRTVKAFDI